MPLLAMILAGALSTGDAQRREPPPPAASARRARPMQPLGSYFSADDYPSMEGGVQEGIVGFRLTIGPNGRVTDCGVTRSSGSNALNETTCRILRSRARFAPARDSAGRPVPDHRDGDVLWRLPGEQEEDGDGDGDVEKEE